MAEEMERTLAFQVHWRVLLKTTQKLFCRCSTGPPFDLVAQLGADRGFQRTVLQGQAEPQPSDRDRDLDRIGDSSRSFIPQEQNISEHPKGSSWIDVEELRNGERFGGMGYCAYEQGEMPPRVWSVQALEFAVSLARLCEARLSEPWVVVREYDPWSMSHWRRKCLIAVQGSIPLFDQQVNVRLYLQESLHFFGKYRVVSLPTAQPWILRGMPEVEWVSEPIPGSLVFSLAQRLRDLTSATGWTHDEQGSWSLDCFRHHRLFGTWDTIRTLREVQNYTKDAARIESHPVGPEHLRYREAAWYPSGSSGGFCEPDPELPLLSHPKPTETSVPLELPPLGWSVRMELALLELSPDVIDGILRWGHAALFLECARTNPKVSPHLWGELLFRWPRSLQRKGIPVHQLTPERYLAVASLHGLHRCTRDVLYDLLAFTALYPEIPARHLLTQKMGISPRSWSDWRQHIPVWLGNMEPPVKKSWLAQEKYWMGQLMQHLRGQVPGHEVRDALLQHFSISLSTAHEQGVKPT